MAESEIPEDIRTKALAVSLCHQEPRGCVHPDDNSCEDGCELYAAIAKALLAERDRAAKVLEVKAAAMRGSVTGDMMARIFEAEAAAIRQDNPNETEHGNG